VTSPHLHAVILAGGSGTRFWPLSRRLAPKQSLSLMGDRTMPRLCSALLLPWPPNAWVVTGRDVADEASTVAPSARGRRWLRSPWAGTRPGHRGRGAPIDRCDPDAIMIVLPADHAIGSPKRSANAFTTRQRWRATAIW
jgi:mannose-1-phosphate guanylyltransferase